MRTSTLMLLVGTLAVMTGSLAAQTPTIKGFANDEVELKDILLASPRAGKNRLTAKLVNLGQKPANYAVDIRTEGVSLGMSNYQAFYGYQVSGGQTLSIEVPYEVMAPVISRLIIRLGKLPGPFDREAYSRQSREWQREHPSPRPEYIWREIVTFDVAGQHERGRDRSAEDQAALLSPIVPTQNELDENDARELVKNGCRCVCEGANMPTTIPGIKVFQDEKILYAPGKASNAGGVASSGLEMSQNSMRLPWPKEEVDQRLHQIMKNIHQVCLEKAEKYGSPGNYVSGANIAGFLKVADAMMDHLV